MSVADEQVALIDSTGRVTGAATRRRVRRENLWHQATGVIVRDRLGRIYVHRRTPTKDIYPGRYDCCAGGVVGAGESPYDAAQRELAEELGIRDVPFSPVTRGTYADNATRYQAYVYETVWDGEIRHQPEEVDWGGWMDLAELAEHLADPTWPFVPDTRALMGDWLRERLSDRQPIPSGWDSEATLVEGRWIDRTPRRPEVEGPLRTETRLMPWLAPRLPLAVPEPDVISEQPLRVRHVLVLGDAVQRPTAAMGTAVGEFLQALHAARAGDATARGVPGPASVLAARDRTREQFRTAVVPLLPPDRRSAGQRLLDALADAPADTLVHGDLGPEHLLVDAGVMSGVIDWTDAHVGDPALDLAWTVHGAGPEFAEALVRAYRPDGQTLRRAGMWHRLGPWHEVLYGLDTGQPEFVESGLAGVLDRLNS